MDKNASKKQNWEISFEYHLNKYRALDPYEASVRSGVEFDPEHSRFILHSLGYRLYAEWPEFKLEPDDRGNCPKALYDFQMQVLVLRVLYLGVAVPSAGTFKAYRELPWGDVYDTNFKRRCIDRLAGKFGTKLEVFIKAAESLGSVSLDFGDAAFDFSFPGDVTCRLILWTADDEFPPSAQILFSDNSQFMYNAEDLASVGDVVISALSEVLKAKSA